MTLFEKCISTVYLKEWCFIKTLSSKYLHCYHYKYICFRKKRYPGVDEHQQNNYPTYSQYNDTHPEETCKEDRYGLHLVTQILFFILFFQMWCIHKLRIHISSYTGLNL